MILCNLTTHNEIIDHVARQFELLQLVELMNDAHLECKSYATMTVCNLASKHIHGAALVMAGCITRLVTILSSLSGVPIQRAALLATYNISTYEASHTLLAKEDVIQSVILSCRSPDVLCRRFALMILSNVACNDKTRTSATKGGGLQASVLALKDDDLSTVRFACICLSNMANDSTIQSQILVHGGLPSLVSLTHLDGETRDCALMCLSNVAANDSNHSPLMKQGAFKSFVDAFNASTEMCHLFGIANLTSNPEILAQVGRGGGIRPLIALAKSNNLQLQCLAISGLRRLALIRENRDRLIIEGAVQILAKLTTHDPEVQKEIAGCFCNLTLSPGHRVDITRTIIPELSSLSKSNNDIETARLSLGAIANLAEDIDTHSCMKQAHILSSVLIGLGHQEIDIKREAARATSNLLSSQDFHAEVIEHGLENLIQISAISCDECHYLTALSFRKLSPTLASHHTLVNNGLQNILALTKVADKMTRVHAATSIRDLSASDGIDKANFFKHGTIAAMLELVKDNEKDLQIIAIATLRHLSPSKHIRDDFSSSVMVKSVVRCLSWANDDMKCQIGGLFANLSEHMEFHSIMVTQGIIPALGKLALTENDEIKQVSVHHLN
jgi:hypothetical protein